MYDKQIITEQVFLLYPHKLKNSRWFYENYTTFCREQYYSLVISNKKRRKTNSDRTYGL